MLNSNIDFELLTEYSTFLKEWKTKYKQLSADIRAAKIAFKDAQRSDSSGGNTERSALYELQYKARFMLNDRVERKFRWKEYLSNLETSAREAA